MKTVDCLNKRQSKTKIGRENRQGNSRQVESHMFQLWSLLEFIEDLTESAGETNANPAAQVHVQQPGDDEYVIHRQRGIDSGQPDLEPGSGECRQNVKSESWQILWIRMPMAQDISAD